MNTSEPLIDTVTVAWHLRPPLLNTARWHRTIDDEPPGVCKRYQEVQRRNVAAYQQPDFTAHHLWQHVVSDELQPLILSLSNLKL